VTPDRAISNPKKPSILRQRRQCHPAVKILSSQSREHEHEVALSQFFCPNLDGGIIRETTARNKWTGFLNFKPDRKANVTHSVSTAPPKARSAGCAVAYWG